MRRGTAVRHKTRRRLITGFLSGTVFHSASLLFDRPEAAVQSSAFTRCFAPPFLTGNNKKGVGYEEANIRNCSIGSRKG